MMDVDVEVVVVVVGPRFDKYGFVPVLAIADANDDDGRGRKESSGFVLSFDEVAAAGRQLCW